MKSIHVRLLLRRFALPLSIAAAVAGTIAGSAAPASSAASSSTPDLSGVTLNVGDEVNGLQNLAKASGAFAGTPYTINWVEFQSGATQLQAQAAGATDFGFTGDCTLSEAIQGGLNVKIIAVGRSDGAISSIVVQGNSGIKKVSQLRGKTIVLSTAPGGNAEEVLADVLHKAHIPWSAIHTEYVLYPAGLAAFASDQIQIWATTGLYPLDALSYGGALVTGNAAAGTSSGNGLAYASPAALADPAKKAAIADFLHRLAEADAWAIANKATYAQDIATDDGGLPLATANTLVGDELGYLEPPTAKFIKPSQQVNDLFYKDGALTEDVKLQPLADTSVFPKALPGTPANGLPKKG
jgi:sulfonate transport system substrate-binding protein